MIVAVAVIVMTVVEIATSVAQLIVNHVAMKLHLE